MGDASELSAALIDGKILSRSVTDALSSRVRFLAEHGVCPKLAVLLVGDDPASQTYVRSKERLCKKLGLASEVIRLSDDISKGALLAEIARLNADPLTHGILVQLPLPKHLDEREILFSISPDKDVDGFHPANVGLLASGAPRFVPCTPKGIMSMLDSIGCEIEGKRCVVVGRSNIVGKPIAQLLLARSATVTICHSRTRSLADFTREADILVVAVGRPRMITGDMVKPGSVVVDVGVNRVDGKLCGDVDFESASRVASWITPVPGGVGLMTVAMLMENTVESAERSAGIII
ncbi:MAG: bifunctional methylenetetrahydrofolate dehydrogenase/methenyltetrahydrofolate cyclohydrolase FolD [Oscillospiraceae bacterium]|jgi:methylenetetrahydrofolate dehydrogenase (NADP+)/methenyltetrahydrofolate cyclohydrolase|nr:bifunctional methylenetetrahydrofolate dehydrogenase/methenyltetrahydrofolate cyclohydrolase FolD [Oscillospiraceae bacterium]